MQDRFKVRLWDITKRKFIKVTEIDYYDDCEEVVVYYDGDTFETALDKEYLKACFLEQCSGLKDKTGKLIYEGDILVSNDECFREKYRVKFRQKYSQFILVGINTTGGSFGIIEPNSLEIIGNIHENPELLED